MERKMLKVMGIVGIWIGTMFMIFGFVNTGLSAESEKMTVVCTTSILADHAREMGRNLVEVVSIVPAGVCPAHYDVKPSDIKAVSTASLILSQGIEPWLDDLIKVSGNQNLRRITLEGSTVPPRAIEEIKMIKEALCEVDTENAPYYEKNTQEFINYIEETAGEIKRRAKELGVQRYKVICIKWQEYFTRWVGFDVIGTYPPPERISWKEVFELIKIGKKLNVALVVDNLQSGTEFGAKLASEIGAAHAVSINFPGSVLGTESYVEMIKYKANQLFDAIEKISSDL